MILPDYRHKLNNAETLRGINPHKMKHSTKVDLRWQYKTVIHYSVIVSLIITISLFRFFPVLEYAESPIQLVQEIIEIDQVDITRQENRPPPPQRPPIVIEVPSDIVTDVLEFTWTDIEIFDNAPPPVRLPVEDEEDTESYFVAVEQMPELIGGVASILEYLKYPELARRAGVEGTVYVLAYVDEEGIVQKVEIARGIGAGLDEAAMEAVSQVRFIPGMQRGVPRKVVVTVPVRFKLFTSSSGLNSFKVPWYMCISLAYS